MGGTQTNLVVIDALLRPYEAVISAHTGHVNVHETGAIEATGHKVCTVPSPDGKLTPELIAAVTAAHSSEAYGPSPTRVHLRHHRGRHRLHQSRADRPASVLPGAGYLLLYLDGARLGSALTSPANDLTLPDLAALTERRSYIGGTKNGALFGEALVMRVPCPHFRWHMKQRGAVLAKGRLLGVQFQALLENGLYFDLASHANAMALRLRDGIAAQGYPFALPSPSNQQFPILPNAAAERLQEMGYAFEVDHPVDESHTWAFAWSPVGPHRPRRRISF